MMSPPSETGKMTTVSGERRGRAFVGGLDTAIESENERYG